MLKLDKSILIILPIVFFFISCNYDQKKDNVSSNNYNNIRLFGRKYFGVQFYDKLYAQSSDTINSWVENNLISDSSNNNISVTRYILDSSICISTGKDKIIGTLLHFNGFQPEHFSDGLEEFYGVKIKGKWYYWTGGYTPIIRKGFKGHNPQYPLNYNQLHSFVGFSYLDNNLNIREEWFKERFSGDGWINFEERYNDINILDGNRIDNEKDYWNYKWKRKGLGLWIEKFSNDSIIKRENQIGRKLDTEEQNSIRRFISSKMVLKI